MHVFYSRQDTLCKALLTERVQLYITGTNLLPSRAVAFILFILPAVTLVLLIGFCFMLLAVQTVSQLRTAGIGTGLLWFLWHRVHFLFGHRKSRRPVFITDLRLCFFIFSRYYYSTLHTVLHCILLYCLCGKEIFLRASRCSLYIFSIP